MYTKTIMMCASCGLLVLGLGWEAVQAAEPVPSTQRFAKQLESNAVRHAVASMDGTVLASAGPRNVSNTSKPHHIAPQCVQVNSSSSFSCKDSGGYDSTCATAKCGSGHTLTGGGGACAAGNSRIKSLAPKFSKGEYSIMCEKQGAKPQAKAICCKL